MNKEHQTPVSNDHDRSIFHPTKSSFCLMKPWESRTNTFSILSSPLQSYHLLYLKQKQIAFMKTLWTVFQITLSVTLPVSTCWSDLLSLIRVKYALKLIWFLSDQNQYFVNSTLKGENFNYGAIRWHLCHILPLILCTGLQKKKK